MVDAVRKALRRTWRTMFLTPVAVTTSRRKRGHKKIKWCAEWTNGAWEHCSGLRLPTAGPEFRKRLAVQYFNYVLYAISNAITPSPGVIMLVLQTPSNSTPLDVILNQSSLRLCHASSTVDAAIALPVLTQR